MSTLIPATKLHAPPPRPEAVPRPRLQRMLDDGIGRRLTLVSAPAGFGKTSLVSAWIAALDRPVAWLSLDSGDADSGVFLEHLLAALDAVLPAGLYGPGASPAPPSAIGLATALGHFAEPPVIVLDDYHETDGQVDEALSFLLANLPEGAHVVIVTRTDPALPLARLRARAQLTEIREADLRFRPDEATSFLLDTMGLDLLPEQVALLEERTEGWIAGLQLAALSTRERSQRDDADAARRGVERFAGNHRYVLDYLLDEVLDRQEPEMREFLLSTCILDRFNASLCNALTGRSDGRDLLLRAERANLFVIALDDRREWYRYHHLFADALRAQLTTEPGRKSAELHRRAAAWFVGSGMHAEAIHHALEGGDVDRAVVLLEKVWPEMDENYRSAPWLRWVRRLPEDRIAGRPPLCLGLAWALLNRGDLEAAETWLEKAAAAGPEAEGLQILPGVIAAAHAYRFLTAGRLKEGEDHARKALALPSDSRGASHRQGKALLGVARWSVGDLATADGILEGFMADMIAAGNWTDAMIAFVLAEIRMDLGRVQSGIDACLRLLSLTEREAGGTALAMGDIHRALADLYLERHQTQTAAEHLSRAEALGEYATLPNWTFRLLRSQARMSRSTGRLEEAIDLLEEAGRCYTAAPLPIPRPADAEAARIHIAAGNLEAAENWERSAAPTGAAYLQEYELATRARLMIARGMKGEADRILEAMQRSAEAAGRTGATIELMVLRSLAQDSPELLHTALLRAQPEGILRPFVDEARALSGLLQHALDHGIAPRLTRRILTTIRPPETMPVGNRQLPEALSEREVEVLQMLATDMSGPQISNELVVSLNTLRTHTRNIYGKLAVNNRRAALRRAEELGLL